MLRNESTGSTERGLGPCWLDFNTACIYAGTVGRAPEVRLDASQKPKVGFETFDFDQTRKETRTSPMTASRFENDRKKEEKSSSVREVEW